MSMNIYNHWINGTHHEPASGEWIDSHDPYTTEVWSKIPRGNEADANLAAEAARNAMTVGPWANMSATARGKILRRIGDAVLDNIEPLALLEVRDSGKLLVDARAQLKSKAEFWYYYAGLADKIEGSVMPLEKPDVFGFTLREPVGVVLALTAWNAPLLFIALKCAPALAAGCSVVIKPSEFTSASSLAFARLTKAAGLPDGVLNVVTGYGAEIGAALVDHPKIAHVSFTGSDLNGAKIYAAAAKGMKGVTMELGGKSPNIVFADADLELAAAGALTGIFGAAGQMCAAGSRLFVQNTIKDEFVAMLIARAKTIKLGSPMDAATQMGPIATPPQFQKVKDYVAIAKAEGARCMIGGQPATGAGIEGGQFYEPTIFVDVTNNMRIAQEEVFGPVLSVIGFEDEAEAIALGNDTQYGLVAGVWTKDIGRLIRMAKALEVGTVWGNTYRSYSYTMPLGGRKRSGVGREYGIEAINEFLETKSVMISTATKPREGFGPV
jgi:(Z)-2-((N-methylformamido)methylene)-5-hydroxybutyrolactone dehydrogenase